MDRGDMAAAPWRRRRGRGAAIVASIFVHGAVLALLAISAVPAMKEAAAPRVPPDVTLYLEPLQPRLREKAASLAAPRAAAAPAKAAPLPPAAPRNVTPRPAVSPPPPERLATPNPPDPIQHPTPAPSPSAVAQGAARGPSPPAGDGRDWRVRPEGGDVHGLVHEAIGCGHQQYLKLTTAEQAACDRSYASLRGQDTPHIDLIPAEKRAYYDAVIQKREDQRYAAFKTLHDMQLARAASGEKTHGIDINVGYQCSFKFGVGAKEANAAAGRKLGFPPCPIHAPGAEPTPP